MPRLTIEQLHQLHANIERKLTGDRDNDMYQRILLNNVKSRIAEMEKLCQN